MVYKMYKDNSPRVFEIFFWNFLVSACVGGGVDLITATDIRLATRDAWFCVKEVDMGLAADVGTLQRLPKAPVNISHFAGIL